VLLAAESTPSNHRSSSGGEEQQHKHSAHPTLLCAVEIEQTLGWMGVLKQEDKQPTRIFTHAHALSKKHTSTKKTFEKSSSKLDIILMKYESIDSIVTVCRFKYSNF